MHEGYSMETCTHCGKRFMSDSGDDFCSSSCEREYEREHVECERCGNEVGEDNLERGLCEWCLEYLEGRGDKE
jgi:hypothetical protein